MKLYGSWRLILMIWNQSRRVSLPVRFIEGLAEPIPLGAGD
jgi:hypothetical protein